MVRRPFHIVAAAALGIVVLVTLAPAQVGTGTFLPVPVIQAALPPPVTFLAKQTEDDDEEADAADPIDVLVSALSYCSSALSPAQRLRVARIIQEESEEHGYDPLFITALVQIESGCSFTARGGDAIGLVQLLPSTARDVARRAGMPWRGERTLTEPSSSISLGLRYLGELEEQLGDPYRAVAAYNLGPARVARMSSLRARQTRYVRKILSRYERLLDRYA